MLDQFLKWLPVLVQVISTSAIVFAAGRYIEKLNQTLIFNQRVLNNIENDLRDHIEKDDERHDRMMELIMSLRGLSGGGKGGR